jgi:hypothetical protein
MAFAVNNTYEIDEIGMSISIPDDMLTITRDSKKTDTYFSTFGLDYTETMSNLTEGNIYLQAMKEDGSLTITVTMAETEDSKEFGNYNDLSEAEINSITSGYLKDKTYKSCAVAKYNGNTYMNLIVNTKSGNKTVQAQQSSTVVGGKLYTVSMYASAGKKLTDDNKTLMGTILSSVSITESNFFTDNMETIIFVGIIAIAGIAMIVLFIVLIKYLKNPVRKNKVLVHELAHEHRITETTQIPKKRINKKAIHDEAFLDEYEPLGDNSRKKATVADNIKAEKAVSTPVPEEELEQLEDIIVPEKIQEEIVEQTTEKSDIEEIIEEAKSQVISDEAEENNNEVEEVIPDQVIEDTEPVVQGEENLESATDYFDDVPKEEEMYSYTDVETAVDEYSTAHREARRSREYDRPDKKEYSSQAKDVALKVLKAIGRGILSVLQVIWMIICFVVIHLRYFCINVYRLIKRKNAQRKRRKAEEERKRRAEERRRRQREAEMNRRRQNANRGENDLIKVHSRDERVPRQTRNYSSGSRPTSRNTRR